MALAGAEQDFEVIDRTHLASIIREHELAQQGLIDPQTARELGKITGVEALVTGTLTPFGDSVRVTVKLLDSESAQLIASTAGRLPMTEAIAELMSRGIQRPQPRQKTSGAQGGAQSPSEGEKPEPLRVFEANGVTFELHSCNTGRDQLICEITVLNKSEDTVLTVHTNNRSRVFDPKGNAHRLSSITFGGQSGDRRYLVQGLPVKMKVTFQGFPSNAFFVPLANLSCYARGGFYVEFRNVPIP